jgi:hypothetical protein
MRNARIPNGRPLVRRRPAPARRAVRRAVHFCKTTKRTNLGNLNEINHHVTVTSLGGEHRSLWQNKPITTQDPTRASRWRNKANASRNSPAPRRASDATISAKRQNETPLFPHAKSVPCGWERKIPSSARRTDGVQHIGIAAPIEAGSSEIGRRFCKFPAIFPDRRELRTCGGSGGNQGAREPTQ